MSQRDPNTHLGAFLGRRLQRARVKAGFASQEALAGKLHIDRTVIAKAESGERPPTPEVLAAWCELTGITDPDMYADLCELARVLNGAVPEWFRPWLDFEGLATSLRIWHPTLVPGLFHTEAYARAILQLGGGDVDARVAARLERSKILDRDDSPDVVAVFNEYALRNMIGSVETMSEQLARVVDVSRRPNVVVQVVPVGIGAYGGESGAFDIASAPSMNDLIRMESVPQDVTTETRSVVRAAAVAFDQIRAEALPQRQSRDLIVRLNEELWTPKA